MSIHRGGIRDCPENEGHPPVHCVVTTSLPLVCVLPVSIVRGSCRRREIGPAETPTRSASEDMRWEANMPTEVCMPRVLNRSLLISRVTGASHLKVPRYSVRRCPGAAGMRVRRGGNGSLIENAAPPRQLFSSTRMASGFPAPDSFTVQEPLGRTIGRKRVPSTCSFFRWQWEGGTGDVVGVSICGRVHRVSPRQGLGIYWARHHGLTPMATACRPVWG